MTQAIWTVLPNGINGQTLKLSVFISLRVDGSVGAVGNWTQRMKDLTSTTLRFDAGSGTAIPVTLTIDKTLLTPTLWTATFPAATPVRPRRVVTHSTRDLYTFPSSEIRTKTHQLYKDMGENFGLVAQPSVGTYGSPLLQAELGQHISNVGAAVVDYELNTSHPALNSAEFRNSSPFYRAHRFYRRILNPGPATTPQPITKPVPDFHDAVGMLGDHPSLLRRLGLILDCTIQKPAFDAAMALLGAGNRRVSFTAPSGDRAPWTNFVVTTFTTQTDTDPTRGTDLKSGMLRLGDTSLYDVHQLDVDSAALKLLDFATNQKQALLEGHFDYTSETPSLQTAGIVVHRTGRGAQLKKRLGRSETLETESDAGAGLFADDVVRGYRIDVQRQSDGIWRSLCQRQGSYLVGSASVRVPAAGDLHDEGYVKGTGATSDADAQPSASQPLYLHEALFAWDGWSAVVKAPGKSIVFSDSTGSPAENVQRVENLPDGAVQVQPVFKAEPHSLPKLRFGESYRVRARAVDLAGNSVPLTTATTDEVLSPVVPYRRYEAVPAPALVLRNPVVEGESLEHIVIRSVGSGAPILAGPYFSSNDRHVAPPTAPLELSIQHGMLDPFFGDPTRSYNIALKSEGTFLDPLVWDGLFGLRLPQLGLAIINSPEVPAGTSTAPPARGQGLEPGQYVIHRTDPILPYLPDPLAVGFAISDARATADQTTPSVGITKMNFNGSWPGLQPLHITVQASLQANPSVSTGLTGVVVQLPPATILPLYSTSVITEASLQKMAIWALLSPAKQAEMKAAALNGQHWMLTPRRKILAVHAVQRPLSAAQITALDIVPKRAAGDTFVILDLTIANHSRSTGQLDVEAKWNDQVDRLADPGPTAEAHAGRVLMYTPKYDEPSAHIPFSQVVNDETRPKHDFGDTKHRIVNYRADATTRYREYFPPSVTNTPSNIQVTGVERALSIPSSARPKEPEVLYVVPTFKWDSSVSQSGLFPFQTTTGTTSRRIGRGLRVYMSRPWFSSGEGELLAALVAGASGASDSARKYISEWGADPIWSRSGSFTQLAEGDFLNAAHVSDSHLKLAEDSSLEVKAVGFGVEYSADRRVWFADIELGESGSYTPFVRLALARYQPDSIDGVHLSTVVRAEFAQLVNDRTAALQFDASNIQISISGIAAKNVFGKKVEGVIPPGPAPTPPPGFVPDPGAGAGRVVTVQVERRLLGHSELEWDLVSGPVVLPSFSPTPSASGQVLWSGSIPRPVRTLTTFEQRVVIREVEVFETDDGIGEVLPVPSTDGRPVRGRVTYLDVIPLEPLGIL